MLIHAESMRIRAGAGGFYPNVRSKVDRSMVDRSMVDRSMVDRSRVERSRVEKSGVNDEVRTSCGVTALLLRECWETIW